MTHAYSFISDTLHICGYVTHTFIYHFQETYRDVDVG
jgi:hypothetical protein